MALTPAQAQQACQKFIEHALEASLYLRPDGYGLTEAELATAATECGHRGGILRDARKILEGAQVIVFNGDRLVFGPRHPPSFTNFLFGKHDPERRNFAALDAIIEHLRELAADQGQDDAKDTRERLLLAATRKGASRPVATVAFETLRLADTLVEGDGFWQVAGRKLNWPLPSEQVAQARSTNPRKDAEKVYECVKRVLGAGDASSVPAHTAMPVPPPASTVAAAPGKVETEAMRVMKSEPDSRKIFVIHGRCEPARHETGIFLRALGLEPLWFRDVRKDMGGTTHIIKVVERGMELAQGILALVTPDEFSALRPDLRSPGESGEAVERWQARPNVIFEAGMAYGIDPDRVAFVLFGDAKLFTDAAGIHVFWPTNDHGPDSHRAQLRGLLAGATMKCTVNMHSDDWMTAGNFDSVIKGLSGVSARDPFCPTPFKV